ncbi:MULTISPECIES: sensor histidine kinase [Tenacibaculum]|uniref:histidine kinase n=1 Tax=Tenacibaculum discolor TaxID=361581 RepID=A0A2G1BQN8_9FLAO|nr:HAMP domain-containing sensor histidine kinase [Tenacibaculum discolor]MDP2541027.1 HAMP domain-containing sensor histidine kinase [Tenacibaculum discolor]PHN96318.1 two-component sensor histidine kinase [Tenacibaculum discolor]PHO00980.1 two-component sensor histidine kinase [Rhodobacteraceae bacterium 4F10]RLK00079.1 two-component system phosphate regulon sensor histidine kinase PhoR [Tenacibaculum discolor]
MGKKIFILIVVLMSISLIGIISIQVYWINDAIKNKKEQFKNNVKIALARTSENIKEREYLEFQQNYKDYFENDKFRTEAEITTFLFQQVDTVSKKKFSFGSTILEESIKMPSDFVDNDSIIIKRYSGKEDIYFSQIIKSESKDFKPFLDESRHSSFRIYSTWNDEVMEHAFRRSKAVFPINQRISNKELSNTLKEEFAKMNITQDFKYVVYEDGLATQLKSGYFNIQPEDINYPLLEDENGNSKYKLYVKFPNEKKNLLSGMMKVLILSLFFIGIIIAAFSTSLYQLIRQKKISEIKTDFINNMTHEFKTPIATINLALDAIKNPKIISDEEKVKRYVQMIRDENKRMHGQVENVLRISRLEKNQIEMSKDAVDMHDIIEEAIEHIQLLTDDKKGSVTTHFEAISTEVLGNQFHLTNVVVNMLENALKYSENAPKIDVFTENTNKYFIFKIKDEGIGMSRNAQKYVFDKFYREHKGNIHNVKGHGLGLAYVKEIIDSHQGTVYVESEKGKGSTFTVKLPLI